MKELVLRTALVRVAPSPIHGLGVFAEENIRGGSLVAEYIGHIITIEAGVRLVANGKGQFLFGLRSGMVLDGSVSWNTPAKFINHSCRGNCLTFAKEDRVLVYALLNIRQGVELTYNYGPGYFDRFILPRGCNCPEC